MAKSKDTGAAQEHPGVPDSQWEAEHPPEEVAAQEAAEIESRMPDEAALAGDPPVPPEDAGGTVPASGNQAGKQEPESAEAEHARKSK
jgi:hypothetical protein